MSRTTLAAAAVLVTLLTAGLGAAYFAGLGPAPGGSDDIAPITPTPTATAAGPTASGSGTGSPATTGTEVAEAPFAFAIDRIEECGQTCRDVTATLTNQQDETASNVTVVTRIYAGEDNTADDDLVWSGEEGVGTLEAGGSHTATKRVELSLSEGLKVENHGGWVTIVTTVQTDERTVTFTDTRQVA